MGSMSFPSSPTEGQVYEKWQYNATTGQWEIIPVQVSPAPPVWTELPNDDIKRNSKVGIGKTPNANLDVQTESNSVGMRLGLDVASDRDLVISSYAVETTNAAGWDFNASDASHGQISFSTTGSKRLTIDHTGNATFSGTVNASSFVKSGGTASQYLMANGTVSTGYALPLATAIDRVGVQIGYATSGKNYAVQLSSEKMYVNVPWTDTNTTYTAGNGLSLSGTQFLMSGSYSGTFTATGDVVAFSDIAVKEDINPITAALEKVSQLGGYTFKRKNDDSRKYTGVIAQEVQKVLPEAVHSGEEGLSVAYGNLVGLLIEAVKEQQTQIDDLKRKVEG